MASFVVTNLTVVTVEVLTVDVPIVGRVMRVTHVYQTVGMTNDIPLDYPQGTVCGDCECKDKLIEQMREALSLILEGAIHDFHYACQHRNSCLCWGCQKRRVNAALAAERGENQ